MVLDTQKPSHTKQAVFQHSAQKADGPAVALGWTTLVVYGQVLTLGVGDTLTTGDYRSLYDWSREYMLAPARSDNPIL